MPEKVPPVEPVISVDKLIGAAPSHIGLGLVQVASNADTLIV